MKTIQIQLDKIDKSEIFVGKVHKYLNATLHDNKDGKDEYGNDGFVTQSISKEKREAGERGPIIGNWKEVVFNKPKSEGANVNINPTIGDDDLPF